MFKKLSFMTVSSILLAHVSATSEKFTAPLDAAFKSSGKSQEDQTEQHYKSDGFLNLNVSHERDNKFAFGSRNCSVVGLTPLLSIGKLVVEADFFFGSFQSFNGWIKGERYLSRTTPQKNRSYLHNNFNQGKKIKKALEPIMAQALDRAHFYRNYTRIIYTDQASNFRVVVGDTKVSNTVGFQQPLSGGGLSIFRQKGNGSVIGAGSPLVITAASKVECKMGNDSVATMLFAPGVYSIDDMPEEAKLPGVSLKISDQVKRREVLKVEYFGGYGTLAEGMNDFDLTIVCDHHWNLEDPHRIRYQKKPRYSGNYRYGLNDNMTLGGGLQVHENSYLLDCVMIFDTDLGKIAPNIAYSDARKTNGSKKRAAGAGIFYSIPENELGIFLETFAATKGKHFGDLGRGEEREEAYNKFIEKYFSDNDIREKLKNSTEDSSSRQITARLYSKPIEGFVPALIFNGKWSKTERLREYTLSLTKAFDFCSFTVSGGLTYDDPDKGRNLRSPDRRLAIVCNIKIGTDLSVGGDYVYYDEEKRRSHIITTYAPHEIKGLEFGAEMTSKPGFSYPYFSAKYNSEYFNLEAEESIINTYEDKEAATVNSHSNRQKLCFGTNISPNGIRALQKVNFNVLRGVE